MSPRTAPMVPGRSGPPIGGVGISAITWPSADLQPQVAEREAALGEPVVDADRLERLERVALERDAVADAAQLVAQVDEHHLDALLGERRATARRRRCRRRRRGRGWTADSVMGSPCGDGGAGGPPSSAIRSRTSSTGSSVGREVEEAVQHAVGLHVAYVDPGGREQVDERLARWCAGRRTPR